MSALILVVDDDPWLMRMVLGLVERRGHRGLAAARGEDALGWAWQRRPDLIIIDVAMPGMDGWTLARTLRLYPELAHIPIVFLVPSSSGNIDVSRRPEYRADIDGFVAKPFRVEALDAHVEAALARRAAAPPPPAPPPDEELVIEIDPYEVEAEPVLEAEPVREPEPPRTPAPAAAGRPSSRPTGVHGRLAHLRLPSLLTVMGLDRAEGILVVKRGDEQGRLLLCGGRIVGATLEPRGLRGAEAVYPMLEWHDGSFKFTSTTVDTNDEIRCSIESLLLEGARRSDEAGRGEALAAGGDADEQQGGDVI